VRPECVRRPFTLTAMKNRNISMKLVTKLARIDDTDETEKPVMT